MPLRHVYRAIVLAAFLALSGCHGPDTAPPRKLTGTQIADRAEPATVNIVVALDLTAQVPEPTIDTAALVIATEQHGSSDDSAAGKYRTLMNVLLSQPERFLIPSSDTRSAKTTIHSQGSGVIFTSDGYVATNAHVVVPGPDDLKEAMVNSAKQWVESDVTGLDEAIHRAFPQSDMTDNAKERLVRVLAQYYLNSVRLSDVSPSIYAVMGYNQRGGDLAIVGARCTVKKVGEPIPGKDVAILKMEGSNFPTLPLASSLTASGLRTGADVYIVGFPGAISLTSDFTLPSRLEPSQTVGHVSAIKDMEGGWKVIQTDTPINPGNSGGPALNDQGQVVGLATFKLRDQEGINFIVSVDLLQEFIHTLNVKPDSSKFTQKYLQALDAYEHNRRDRALALFRDLSSERQGIRSVENFIQQLSASGSGTTGSGTTVNVSDNPRKAENQQTVSETPRHGGGPLIIFGLMAVVIAVIVIIVVAANRN